MSIVLYYLYNNYTLEGLTSKKKATLEEATVEGYREGRRGRSRSTTLGANGQRYNTGW